MRILGIDLGSYSIKLVEMDSAFGRFEIHDYHEHIFKPSDDPEKALTSLLSHLKKTPDKLIVALSSSRVTLRNLQLPTKDKKTIQSTVGFELEDELPFPSDEAVYDYSILTQGKQGSFVHIAATIKRHIVMTLLNWENVNIDPDYLTTEVWAYRSLLNRCTGIPPVTSTPAAVAISPLPEPASSPSPVTAPASAEPFTQEDVDSLTSDTPEPQENLVSPPPSLAEAPPRVALALATHSPAAHQQIAPVLLVNLGHEKSAFYLQWKSTPQLIREINWGGKDLTHSLAMKLGLSHEEAESAKIDRGLVITDEQAKRELSPEQIALAECLESELISFFSGDLRQVELGARNVTGHTISQIYLTGGTSLLPGICDWFIQITGIPTQLLPALSSVTNSGVTYSDQTNARFLLAAALSLCLVGNEKSTCINFRRGEFAKHGKKREFNAKILKKPLLAACIVMICMLTSVTVQNRAYEAKIATTQTQLERSVRTFFGTVPASTMKTYMSRTSVLKDSVSAELTKKREIAKLYAANTHSPLDFLKKLSTSISKEVTVDLAEFQAGVPPSEPYATSSSDAQTTLAFVVANPQVGEKLASAISGAFDGITKGSVEEFAAVEGEPKKWKIQFQGKLKEDFYGK